MKIYIDGRDWWIGYYRGETYHYVCLLPTVVIQWGRSFKVNCSRGGGHKVRIRYR